MTREEAIITLTNTASLLRDGTRYMKPEHEKQFREAYEMAIKALEQPERKKGKWLPDNNSVYEMRFVCSECKESQVVPTIGFTKYKPIWDFCPNCGADMREDGEADADVKS